MNIDELTLGQIKEINKMVFVQSQQFEPLEQCKTNITGDMVGKYVIVRSRNEGVNAGYVEAADETGIVLTDARRIWYHKPLDKKMSWYEGVAISGLSSDSKVSAPVERKIIIEDYSITQCTEAAIKSISGHKTHEQN